MNKYARPIIYQNKYTGNTMTIVGYEYVSGVPNQLKVYVTDIGDKFGRQYISEHFTQIQPDKPLWGYCQHCGEEIEWVNESWQHTSGLIYRHPPEPEQV